MVWWVFGGGLVWVECCCLIWFWCGMVLVVVCFWLLAVYRSCWIGSVSLRLVVGRCCGVWMGVSGVLFWCACVRVCGI